MGHHSLSGPSQSSSYHLSNVPLSYGLQHYNLPPTSNIGSTTGMLDPKASHSQEHNTVDIQKPETFKKRTLLRLV